MQRTKYAGANLRDRGRRAIHSRIATLGSIVIKTIFVPAFILGLGVSVSSMVEASPIHRQVALVAQNKLGRPAASVGGAVASGMKEAPKAPMVVAGFRSAHFGMTEAQVRKAIETDFHVKADAIHAEENPAELTQVLTVGVPNLLEGGGRATVAYVFGYKSKTLIQVSATWSTATDKTMTQARLFSDGNILREHFIESGYEPETIITNAPVTTGLLMFRGSDAKGHTTVLLLQGKFRTEKDNRRVLTPSALILYYVADPKSPDIFRLPAGSF